MLAFSFLIGKCNIKGIEKIGEKKWPRQEKCFQESILLLFSKLEGYNTFHSLLDLKTCLGYELTKRMGKRLDFN